MGFVMGFWLRDRIQEEPNQSATTKRLRTDANYNIGDSEIAVSKIRKVAEANGKG